MASPEADSRVSEVLIPALDKIIKNGSWRKHSKLVHEWKYETEYLTAPNPPTESPPSSPGVLLDLSFNDSDSILKPLINAASSAHAKIA
ncbi:hypothetical protein LIER_19191 [Lithospermum erythrorhizon]|uniref:Uncharacterized protein n=1 Tax=Lithospermum erythrorhizon TaxID=34254 RepID=A0AAV3QJS6_LITER